MKKRRASDKDLPVQTNSMKLKKGYLNPQELLKTACLIAKMIADTGPTTRHQKIVSIQK